MMDHLQQIQRAVDYIEDHLNDDLPIEALAREAAFSTWHFQIVFKATVGDTVKNYVRSRRLTKSVIELGTSDRKVLDIALDAGFESQESYTRAFKQLFGTTPGECRAQGIKSVLSLSKPRITMEYLDHLNGGMTMQPKIKELEEIKVVGIGNCFISILSPDKNNFVVIPKLWDNYNKRSSEITGRKAHRDLGVCFQPDANQKKHPDECFYIACAEVESFDVIPEGMMTKVIPPGKYAIFTHKGQLEKLQHTMNYIYGAWLAKSGQKLREAPDLEIYDERFKFGSVDSELDIYIPIK